jgi:hypothetical protein
MGFQPGGQEHTRVNEQCPLQGKRESRSTELKDKGPAEKVDKGPPEWEYRHSTQWAVPEMWMEESG